MTAENDFTLADPDLRKGHPLLQERWPLLLGVLEGLGFQMMVIECYRPELRQQWLYGSGRTVAQLSDKGISARFANPQSPRVTNAWSAQLSAHGVTERLGPGQVVPASAALDVCPVGLDGRAWTKDDPWDDFVKAMVTEGPIFGLAHFSSPGKGVWDRPHLELREWSNREHRLILS